MLFKAVAGPDGGTTFAPESHPNVTLTRDGEALVVTHLLDKQWYFRTYDGGNSWMLDKIESLRLPGQVVTLAYNGNNLTEVVYPDGARTILEYENDAVSRVILPSGMYARLHRDERGWIDRVGIFHPDHTVQKEVLQTSVTMTVDGPQSKVWWRDAAASEPGTFLYGFKYENDANGRIVRFENACGEAFSVEYARAKTDKGEVYTVIERSLVDETYQFMRHSVSPGKWLQEFGIGSAGQALDSATIITRKAKSRYGHDWLLTEYWDWRIGAIIYNRNESGRLVSKKVGNMPLVEYAYSEGVEVRKEGSSTQIRKFDSQGRLAEESNGKTTNTYSYNAGQTSARITNGRVQMNIEETDNLGNPILVRDESGGSWKYSWTSSGKMASCVSPDGLALTWEYDRFGRIINFQSPESSLNYVRDFLGNIHQVKRGGVVVEEYVWECGKLRNSWQNNGESKSYQYDTSGRLVAMVDKGQGTWRYTYSSANRLKQYGFRRDNQAEWRIWNND